MKKGPYYLMKLEFTKLINMELNFLDHVKQKIFKQNLNKNIFRKLNKMVEIMIVLKQMK